LRFAAISLLVVILSACSTSPRKVREFHPTSEEFYARVGFPYYASVARQKQIEHAAHRLRTGMTEAEVLQMLGEPDYKGGWYYLNFQLRGEIWWYVHSSYSQTPKRVGKYEGAGKVISVTLDPKTRAVIQFDAVDFGVRARE
jgi:outer membrane protein assembly factor BamE (lipoprotein component of BamABCDE complex)